MAPDQPAAVPAGWYPDPHHVSELRWWDGQNWTDTVHPPVAPAPPQVPIAPAVISPVVVAPAVVEPAVVEPAVVEPAVVEPVAVVPDAGLNFAPPGLATPPQSPTENLPSRRELRERGGNTQMSDPASDQASAQAGPAQGLDFLPPVVSTPTAPGPADSGPTDPIPADPFPAALFPPPSMPTPAVPAQPVQPVQPQPTPAQLAPTQSTSTTSVPTAAFPDSSAPSSFDWLTGANAGANTGADLRGETGAGPALSTWGQEPGSSGQDPEELYGSSPTRTSTASGWFIALMPLMAGILSIGAVKGAENYPRYIPEGVAWWMLVAGVLVLLYLITLLLAAADRRKLDWVGYSYPAHWTWALATAPVYLIARTVSVKRETGRNSALLWVWIVLAGAIVGGWFAANYFAPELIEAYTLPFL